MVDRNARTAVGGREPGPATLPLPPSAAVHDMVSLGGSADDTEPATGLLEWRVMIDSYPVGHNLPLILRGQEDMSAQLIYYMLIVPSVLI